MPSHYGKMKTKKDEKTSSYCNKQKEKKVKN